MLFLKKIVTKIKYVSILVVLLILSLPLRVSAQQLVSEVEQTRKVSVMSTLLIYHLGFLVEA